ncbi:MAG: hypothetical protein OXK76_16330 [Gammaproteobacteria bacterium]|nr:hypothetical protein [Gammaproteobacteria bacterium]
MAAILDKVGWRAAVNLSNATLLDPAAGGGEFVVQAAERLVASFRRRGIEPKMRHMRARILAFEIHAPASSRARARVVRRLVAMGVHRRTAAAASAAWIRTGDYLLRDRPSDRFTHVVGNPPYVRWNKIPPRLRAIYEQRLPVQIARGDLYVPFLDRALDELRPGGQCGFVCSDRWRYTAYGVGLRRKWLPLLDVRHDQRVDARDAFNKKVSAYATVLVATKRSRPKAWRARAPRWRGNKGRTLHERGCEIRVGPALGVTAAFVIRGCHAGIETELLAPWVDSHEILEGHIAWKGRYVVSVFDPEGRVVDLRLYPKLERHLAHYRKRLEERYVVRQGAPWYRTIDRLRPVDWQRPKLLVPEIAKKPRIALDRTGLVPSHGLYAIFPPERDVEAVYQALSDGGLACRLAGMTPTLRNGYVRCYKRFLSAVRIE